MFRFGKGGAADPPPSLSWAKRSTTSGRSVGSIFTVRLAFELVLLGLFLFTYRDWRQAQDKVQGLGAASVQLRRDLKDLQVLMQADTQGGAGTAAATQSENEIRTAKHLDELERELDRREKKVAEVEEKLKTLERTGKGREKELGRVKAALIDYTQTYCEERFPDGPAHVLMETTEGEIEIEMAPCDLMPVVTMHFIAQVDRGFWDGKVFFRAESHVIQATNMRLDGSRPRSLVAESIPFQEYSPEYVHHKYTLGIAGRPGGPDFYINMLDNRKIHGPGGQGHNYNGDPDSDSCFAKIVRGTEVADRMQKLPFKREGGLHILEKPVEIRRMRLL